MKKELTILLILICMIASAQNDELRPSYKYTVEKVAISNNVEMAYVDEGAADAPVLLMVHGLGGYIKNWYPTIDGLKDSFRCIVIDLPGYGLSTIQDFNEDDYMAFFAKSVVDFVSKLGLTEVTLMGHSMGGQVSVIVALDNPKWLKKLILAAPAGFEKFTDQEGAALKQFASASAIMNHTEDQIRAAYQVNFVNMPDLGEEMIQDRIKAKQADWFRDYAKVREMGVRGMLDHPVHQDLNKIKVSTLVLFGENDLLIPNKYLHPQLTIVQVADIGNKIPQVKIELIEAAGHMLQMDNPARFNLIVKQSLTY